MLAVLILAAGESSRIGWPKALLKIGHQTFADCILKKCRSVGLQSVYIVTGPDHEAIAPHVSVPCIKNEDYMHGQISSLQKGIRGLAKEVSEILVWPVDQPLIQENTVNEILRAYERERKPLTIPVYQTHKGHPVLYNSDVMKTVLTFEPHRTAKDLVTLFDACLVTVGDPAVVIDIDTQEDYERHIKNVSE
jgi:molybdenum cofactor cytidylyltransferase